MPEKTDAFGRLGWKVLARECFDLERVVAKRPDCEILRLRNGSQVYFALSVPPLNSLEAGFLADALELFRSHADALDGMTLLEKSDAVADFLRQYCITNLVSLDSEQVHAYIEILKSCILGFGVLDVLFNDPEIEEIAVAGAGENNPIRAFHSVFGWLECNFFISTAERAIELANRMALGIGRRITLETPRLNANLPDGCRLNVVAEPLCPNGVSITVRKFREKPFTPEELCRNGTASAEAMAFLWLAMQTDLSVIVAGNTGSGKTTTLNALFYFVPLQERIALLEETPEIRVPHRHVVRLVARPELGFGMKELIVETLRMRPDRVIVGEMRNAEETNAFVDTMLAGQGRGSYATFHGQSGQETLNRLKNLGVNEMDLGSIGAIVVQRRWNSFHQNGVREERRITEICEVCLKGGKASAKKVFGFDYAKKRLVKCGEGKGILEKAEKSFAALEGGAKAALKRKATELGRNAVANDAAGAGLE